MKAVHSIVLIACAALLAACDKLPIPDPNRAAAQKELEAKAIGGACRHAGRALEDCYRLNAKASKAAIFAGWREMNDYMTQNKIDVVQPTVSPKHARKLKPADAETVADEAAVDDAPAPKETHGSRNPALTAG